MHGQKNIKLHCCVDQKPPVNPILKEVDPVQIVQPPCFTSLLKIVFLLFKVYSVVFCVKFFTSLNYLRGVGWNFIFPYVTKRIR